MDLNLLVDITIILFAAFLGGFTASKLKINRIVGYILSGLLLGTIFTDISYSIFSIAEFSLFFLLFILGLETSFDVKKLTKQTFLAPLFQTLVLTALLASVLPFFLNTSIIISILLALLLSSSSILGVHEFLSRSNKSGYKTPVLYWILLQSLLLIPVFFFTDLVISRNLNLVSLLILLLKSALVIYLVFIFSKKTVPYLFKKLSLLEDTDIIVISQILFLLFASLVLSYFGIPLPVTAFLCGVIFSSSDKNSIFINRIGVLKNIFTGLFLVSIGFLFSFNLFFNDVAAILFILILLILVKLIITLFISLLFNHHSKVSFLNSFVLLPVGELGFLLLYVLNRGGLITENIFNVVLALIILTLISGSVLTSFNGNIYMSFKNFCREKFYYLYNLIFNVFDSDSKMPELRKVKLDDHIILVGLGNVGEHLTKILSLTEGDIPFTAVDYSYSKIKNLRKKGIPSVYGDVLDENVLIKSGIESCKAVVVTMQNAVLTESIVNAARKLNPSVKVYVIVQNDMDHAKLSIRGVKNIYSPDLEASFSIVSGILELYGKGDRYSKYVDKYKSNRRFT